MSHSNKTYPRPISDDYQTHMYLGPDSSLADYDEMYGYALTIDGYRYAKDVWGMSGDVCWQKAQSFKQGEKWDGSFEDLRCCLFLSQRNIKWLESGAFAGEERKEFMGIYQRLCELWQSLQNSSDKRFSLKSGSWYACEIFGDEFDDDLCSYSPIKIIGIEPAKSGKSVLVLKFYHANYPCGVQDKEYQLRTVERGQKYFLAKSLSHNPVRFLKIYEINAAWVRKHFPSLTPDARDIQNWLTANV